MQEPFSQDFKRLYEYLEYSSLPMGPWFLILSSVTVTVLVKFHGIKNTSLCSFSCWWTCFVSSFVLK